jgi:3-oxoadipate enol-lactonase
MAELAEALVSSLIGKNPDAAGVERARTAMASCPDATYRRSMEALVTFDMRKNLAHIAVPTLVIAGENDTNAPAPMMERMAARIPGARFVVVPDAGHLANLEQPSAFDAALRDFLRSIRRD